MTAGAVLVAGKALIGFAVPLALAIHELWSLRRRPDDCAPADD